MKCIDTQQHNSIITSNCRNFDRVHPFDVLANRFRNVLGRNFFLCEKKSEQLCNQLVWLLKNDIFHS